MKDMSPFLRSTESKRIRRSKEEAKLKLRQLVINKYYTQRISKIRHTKNSLIKRPLKYTSKMGQTFSSYVRKSNNRLKEKSPEEMEPTATNIEEVPHPNDTLGVRIQCFGPTDIVLVIRNNASFEGSISSISPRRTSSPVVYSRIPAHREVLCRRSKYFKSMLHAPHDFKYQDASNEPDWGVEFCERNYEEINLVSIYKKTPSEMADMVGQILHFAYFDQRALNPDNVQTLLEAANYFQVIDYILSQ